MSNTRYTGGAHPLSGLITAVPRAVRCRPCEGVSTLAVFVYTVLHNLCIAQYYAGIMSNVAALATLMACLLGLAALTSPVSARYLPTKRGSQDGDRLDRLAHLIKELLAESDAAPLDHTAYDQRVFYKREAPYPYPGAARDAVAVPLQVPVPDMGRAQAAAPAAGRN